MNLCVVVTFRLRFPFSLFFPVFSLLFNCACVCTCISVEVVHTCISLRLHLRRLCEPGLNMQICDLLDAVAVVIA